MGISKKPRGLLRGGSALLRPPPGLCWADMLAMGGIMATCFFLFQSADLDITSSVSYAYLEGHFLDFYSYNMAGIASVFHIDLDYLQPLHLLFAAWNIPLKLFGLTDHVKQGEYKLSFPELAWTKLLLVAFLALCSVAVYKCARLITQGDHGQARLCMFLFAANPLTIYSIYWFGGYDIFGLTFTMLGLHAFLQRRHWRFVLWFALATPFKFYALIAFLPLLLLDEKNVWKLLRSLLVAAMPTLACLLLTLLDPGATPLARLRQVQGSTLAIGSGMYPAILPLAFLAICLFAYMKRPAHEQERQKYAVLLPLAAMSALFACIFWYMQWLILLMPWLALAFLFSSNRKYSLLFDTATAALLFIKTFLVYACFPLAEEGFLVDPGKWDLSHTQYVLGNFWVISPKGYGPVRAFFQPGTIMIGRFIPVALYRSLDALLLVCLFSPLILQLMYRIKDTWPAPKLFKAEGAYVRLFCYGGLASYFLPVMAVSAGYTWFPDWTARILEAVMRFN